MNNWKKIALLSSIGATALVMTACNDGNEVVEKKVEHKKEEPKGFSIKPSDKQLDKKMEKEDVVDASATPEGNSAKEKPQKEKPLVISYAPAKEPIDHELLEVKETNSFKVESHTGWEYSPDKTKQATVDGRGKESIEEGFGTLVIREGDRDRLITLADTETQNTIKSVEWIDNDRLFIIVGMAYGTVNKGGQLYEVKLSDHSAKKVFPKLSDKEEVTSIINNGNGTFAYGLHTFTDEEFNEGYTEQKGLSPQY